MLVLEALAVATVLLATVTDLLEHRIYNVLTFPMMLVGIVAHALASGETPWWEGLAATFAVGAPFYILYAVRILKEGDVKLYMALGALLGLKLGGMAALMSVIAWAPIGVFVILVNRELKDLRNLFRKSYQPLFVPFGAAIGCGTLIALRMFHG